jgi:hypothetical protein
MFASVSAGNAINGNALVLRQSLLRVFLHTGDGQRIVTREVFGQISWIAGVLVVIIQRIGDAAESAHTLQAANRPRLSRIARALDLCLRRAGLQEVVDDFVGGLLQLLCGNAGACDQFTRRP